MKARSRAVFLDRDGTINRDVPYCSCPEEFELLPMVAEGIRLLNEHNFKVVVITNQSGIARGYFIEDILTQIHQKMRSELAERGAFIDAIYYCPHHPDENCECRKPKPTMIFKATLDLDIDLRQSYVIGDSNIDTEMGEKAGCKTVIVNADPKIPHGSLEVHPDLICSDLYSGARWIVAQTNVSGENEH